MIFNAAQGRQYLVATASGALRPQAITATTAPGLRAYGRGADYLVITAAGLSGAARDLRPTAPVRA